MKFLFLLHQASALHLSMDLNPSNDSSAYDSTSHSPIIFGDAVLNDDGTPIPTEFFQLDCQSTVSSDVHKAMCHVLDSTKSCGGVNSNTLEVIDSDKLCNSQCIHHLGVLFSQESAPSKDLTSTQTEILNSLMTSVSRGYCESCRPLCWQMNYWFF